MRRFINIIQKITLSIKETINDKPRNLFSHLWYRLRWNLRPMFKSYGKAPLAVDVELSSICNYKCEFCHQATTKPGNKTDKVFMDFELLGRIVDQCIKNKVHSVKVNWRGEPSLDPKLAWKINYMKTRGIPEVIMNTNGSKLTEELSKKLIDARLDKIILSCDSVRPQVYNRIRKGGNFYDFVLNLQNFYRVRGERSRPVIRLNVALTKETKKEKGQIQEYFSHMVDQFRFNTVYQQQGTDGEKRKDKVQGCSQIYQRLIIDCKGNIHPCCSDIKGKLILGNIKDITIKQAWKGVNRIRSLHEGHKARNLTGCKDCDLFSLSELKDNKVVWL